MALTQEQINEVCEFQANLSKDDEWLFFHLAWGRSNGKQVTFEDKYEVMKKWNTLGKPTAEEAYSIGKKDAMNRTKELAQ